MKKAEYIRELKINLESQVSPTELVDILSDYESFFTAGREEGKSDDEISEELGSPAYLAKTLLDEHERTDSNESKGETPKNIANPGRRLFAYFIDAFIAVLPATILSLVFTANIVLPSMMLVMTPSPLAGSSVYLAYSAYTELSVNSFEESTIEESNVEESNADVISKYVYRVGTDEMRSTPTAPGGTLTTTFIISGLAFYLLYSTLCTILFKGQTLGKKIARIKVKRSNTDIATSGAIFTREFLGKLLINSIPIVPIISLLTILLTKDNKALHDMLADTIVTDV